jgi:Zn-dependent protease with chaperone function
MGADNRADRLSLLFKTHPHPLDRINALEKAMGSKWNGVTGSVPGRWMALN